MWRKTNGYLSFGIPKESPYGPFLKSKVLDMIQYGQLQKMIKKWEHREPDCSALVKTGKPLPLEKLVSLFLIFAIGCLLVISIFILENCALFWRKDTSNKNVIENFKSSIADVQESIEDGRCPNALSLSLLIKHSEELIQMSNQDKEKIQDCNIRIRIGDKYNNVNVHHVPYVKTRKKVMIMKSQ